MKSKPTAPQAGRQPSVRKALLAVRKQQTAEAPASRLD